MSAASDKARFYMEQFVPELQEYEQKGIFSREEITAITAKRSDFEHILNARGSTPGDYAHYATYEMNLDALRKKRCKRLGIKTTTFNGQRTIFFIFDRATKKFAGDLGLWMHYIDYCIKQKANKKLSKVFTAALRLHPRQSSLWILAAKHYAETQGDMGAARSYMQRGLRFCRDDQKLYLEYAKLEMVYLAKVGARRQILGLDEEQKTVQDGDDDNMIALPTITAEDLNPRAGNDEDEERSDALKKLATAPAFNGAIVIAIFDAATKQIRGAATTFAGDFFNLVYSFDKVAASSTILQHILDQSRSTSAGSAEAIICELRYQLFGVDPHTAAFPVALASALASIKKNLQSSTNETKRAVAERLILILIPYLDLSDSLDPDVVIVLQATVKKNLKILQQGTSIPTEDLMTSLTSKAGLRDQNAQAGIVDNALVAPAAG